MQDKLQFDKELLYKTVWFHDLGLTETYSNDDLSLELDGANAVN